MEFLLFPIFPQNSLKQRIGTPFKKALKRIGESIFLLTLILEIIFAALFLLGRFWLPTVYLDVDDPLNQADNVEVIAIAAKLLLIAAFFQISDGIQVVVLGALRGL